MSLLPTPWPADPVEGAVGHFDHTLWVKASLIALDDGKISKPESNVPAGKLLATTATDAWSAVDPEAVGGVPSGVIVMWSGTTAPAGWALCDGVDGRPDLRNRFVLGWGTRAQGSSGGEESVTLTGAQSGVAAHTHAMQNASATHSHNVNKYQWKHSHSLAAGGGHSHAMWAMQDVALDSPNARRITGGTQGGAGGSWDGVTGGEHYHSVMNAFTSNPDWAVTEASSATHKHTIDNATAANAAQAHNNMPPYFVLAYIIKL